MADISGADQQHSRIQALIVLAENDNKILAGITSMVKMKEDTLLAMMALDWAPRFVKAGGYRAPNRFFAPNSQHGLR